MSEIGVLGHGVEGDYTEEGDERATRSLLGPADPPTAIIYDHDVTAIAGLGVAYDLGIDVPGSPSLLAWDDSTLCRLAVPPLSAMRRDVHRLREIAARALLGVIAGEEPAIPEAPSLRCVTRGSPAPAPKPAAVVHTVFRTARTPPLSRPS